ncbi:MAG: GAF domain-containing protein [Promethearchaeota archaeon]
MFEHRSLPQQEESESVLQFDSRCALCPKVRQATEVVRGPYGRDDLQAQGWLWGANVLPSSEPQAIAETLLRFLSHMTPCFAAGVLLIDDRRGQIVLFRSRPVDDLFLQAVQQRLMLSYKLCVGTALAEPEIKVVILGDSVSGPYEPPRSLLTTPILSEGHVIGMIIIASVFPDAFCSGDLCTLSVFAARVSTSLSKASLTTAK